MQFDGLIFDLDGVLVNTVPVQIKVWGETFVHYGYAFDEDIYRSHVDGRPAFDGARAVMQDAAEETVHTAVERKETLYLRCLDAGELRVFESARAFVKACHASGYPMAVASSSDHARDVLRMADLLDYFDCVICAKDVRHGKPAPDIFLAAADQLGLGPSQCVVFEDSSAGVQAAKAGGFYCIGISGIRPTEVWLVQTTSKPPSRKFPPDGPSEHSVCWFKAPRTQPRDFPKKATGSIGDEPQMERVPRLHDASGAMRPDFRRLAPASGDLHQIVTEPYAKDGCGQGQLAPTAGTCLRHLHPQMVATPERRQRRLT